VRNPVLGVAALASLLLAAGGASAQSEWIGHPAPEIAPGEWVNSPPLRLADLRGKVVLLEFWTFACSNCRNTLPAIQKWSSLRDGGKFEIVGVHTPELNRERDITALRKEAKALGVTWPVVTDNDYATWNAYRQEYWPVVYLIDKKGTIRYVHIGEGSYAETGAMIDRLTSE
jgi:thiol-disulfide isomerase/thioredoxin